MPTPTCLDTWRETVRELLVRRARQESASGTAGARYTAARSGWARRDIGRGGGKGVHGGWDGT